MTSPIQDTSLGVRAKGFSVCFQVLTLKEKGTFGKENKLNKNEAVVQGSILHNKKAEIF